MTRLSLTPARALELEQEWGCRVFPSTGRPGPGYRDGGEEVVSALVANASDLSSLSDELHLVAHTWPEQYHLDRRRSNVLRALDLPAAAVVLEVGAGCGAITRYLGERCRAVDAIEPQLSRARVARSRCRDLPGVEVFAGLLEDLPPAAAYDVVVVVGVLEYVGSGSLDDEVYQVFLRGLRSRLRPRGALVLAIENQLGTKYLCGAPEDHLGIAWAGLEGYRERLLARTFGPRRLEALVRSAGFEEVAVRGVAPDYKLARAVLDPRCAVEHPGVVQGFHAIPSSDHGSTVRRAADEPATWRTLLDNGVAQHHWNSLLVVAGPSDDVLQELWPRDVLARYSSTDRAAVFCTTAEVRGSGGAATVTKTLLGGGSADGVAVRGYREAVATGPSMLVVMEDEPTDIPELLQRWAEVLRQSTTGGATWDLLPHNMIITKAGLQAIDPEWVVPSADVEHVLARGALLSARALAERGRTNSSDGARLIDVAGRFAVHLGLAPGVVREAADREAWFQAVRILGSTADSTISATRGSLAQQWRHDLDRPVAELAS